MLPVDEGHICREGQVLEMLLHLIVGCDALYRCIWSVCEDARQPDWKAVNAWQAASPPSSELSLSTAQWAANLSLHTSLVRSPVDLSEVQCKWLEVTEHCLKRIGTRPPRPPPPPPPAGAALLGLPPCSQWGGRRLLRAASTNERFTGTRSSTPALLAHCATPKPCSLLIATSPALPAAVKGSHYTHPAPWLGADDGGSEAFSGPSCVL